MEFLSESLGILLAWFVLFSVYSLIRLLIKGFTGVDVCNKSEVDEAKENIKNKISNSKTANYIANGLFCDSDYDENNYFNKINEEKE